MNLAWGMETRSDEIEADFYDAERAKWRYLLAIAIAGANAGAFAFTRSEMFQATVLIGGFAIFGAFGFVGLLRSRQRVGSSEPNT